MKVNASWLVFERYATQSLDKDGMFFVLLEISISLLLIGDCSRNFSGSREWEPSSSYLSGWVGGGGRGGGGEGGRQDKDIIMTTRVSSEYLKSQSQLKQLLEE